MWEELEARVRELDDLSRLGALAGWDMHVMMPPAGAAARARAGGTLAGIAHQRLTDPALGELLDRAGDLEGERARMAERLSWSRARAVRVPERLARELAEAGSAATVAWKQARADDDWGAFEPFLRRNLALAAERAEAIGYQTERYEAHLADFERGVSVQDLEKTFAAIAATLRPVVDAHRDRPQARTLPGGPYDTDAQLTYCRELAVRLGLDPQASRTDLSAHPFTTSPGGPDDVRITTRVHPDDPMPAILATIHETGHALHSAGVPRAWGPAFMGGCRSAGLAESQSRLWENHVGRSREFWQSEVANAAAHLPPLEAAGAEDVYAHVNRVEPSFIRVDADEVTYPFHIILRFELELALSRGELSVDDLPAAWDDGMQRLLGVRPPSARLGVLQDTHWASGYLGYFPTYLLGSMWAAALYEAADRDDLLGWLRANVHARTGLLGTEIVAAATGGDPLDPGHYLRYLTGKFSV